MIWKPKDLCLKLEGEKLKRNHLNNHSNHKMKEPNQLQNQLVKIYFFKEKIKFFGIDVPTHNRKTRAK